MQVSTSESITLCLAPIKAPARAGFQMNAHPVLGVPEVASDFKTTPSFSSVFHDTENRLNCFI